MSLGLSQRLVFRSLKYAFVLQGQETKATHDELFPVPIQLKKYISGFLLPRHSPVICDS